MSVSSYCPVNPCRLPSVLRTPPPSARGWSLAPTPKGFLGGRAQGRQP
ncbi:hypothetical protein SGM_5022 [Streptomyces griseoaurantiacus M045]|uniref:Uncharacterized protein n=1 Tax=Streptomyces griseoaurantiacus M045 TaxID=996637 RepID=F3NPF8_9ACTN|nr:hypothetical protein SGM_5022 [Streptomyces griseoaurantiacus M045]